MIPRLQQILDKFRKAKADTEIVTISEVQEDSPKEESPAPESSLVLVPFFDCVRDDEFSEFF